MEQTNGIPKFEIKLEGLESILSRMIHNFIHASVESDKGEEK